MTCADDTVSTDRAVTTGLSDYDRSTCVDDEIVHESVQTYPEILVALGQPITDWNTSGYTREAYVLCETP